MGIGAAAVAAYGLFTLVGGIIGYVKARSWISLVSGLVSAFLLFWCAVGISGGSVRAAIFSIIVCLLLGGRFAGAWHVSRRLMPDLLMVIFSTAALAAVALGLILSTGSRTALPYVVP